MSKEYCLPPAKFSLFLMSLALCCLLFTACGRSGSANAPHPSDPLHSEAETSSGQDRDSSSQTIDSSTGLSSGGDEDDIPSDSLPPAEGMVRSHLTNEWVSEDIGNSRPLAVIIPNESAALPHYNLSKASVVYEANVEGRMTRLMALFEDWESLNKIGNIRSLRAYYAYWALEWDAFIVHWGGPYFINEVLDKPNVQSLNGETPQDSVAFFRSDDRKDPHNAYANGESLRALILQKDYSLSNRGFADETHYQFAEESAPNTLEQYQSATTASFIDMSSCYPLTRCYFKYNEADGLYYRYQHLSGSSDSPHIDGATGQQLAFKNVLVQFTKHEELGEGYLAFQCHDDTRDGYFFTNGKGIHVTWEKNSDFGATRYYDENGNEIQLNTGKTMVLIVEDGDSFQFE